MLSLCLGLICVNNRKLLNPSGNGGSSTNYLQQWTQRLWSLSLAPTTRRSFSTGLRVFQRFLYFSNIKRPLHECFDEKTLQYFISYCSGVLHIRSCTIRTYFAAIRYYCLATGLADPLRHSNGILKFSIRTLLNATEKLQHQPMHPRLPITNKLLLRICHRLNGSFFGVYWDSLLRASLCCAFYGFLRSGEFTANKFNASRHLTFSDLAFTRNRATIFLKRSKTDRSNNGVYIRYCRTNNYLCPIRHLHIYMKYRSKLFGHLSPDLAPLFIMPNGRALTPAELVKRLRQDTHYVLVQHQQQRKPVFQFISSKFLVVGHLKLIDVIFQFPLLQYLMLSFLCLHFNHK